MKHGLDRPATQAPRRRRALLEYIFFRPPEEIPPEQAQALTRIGLTFAGVLLLLVYETLLGLQTPLQRVAAAAAYAYLLGSIVHYLVISRFPVTRGWRLYAAIVADVTILSLVVHAFGTAAAVFYPLYLWIAVGNGLRFGSHFLHVATAAAVTGFLTATLTSPAWASHPPLVIGLLLGIIIMPLFFLALLRQLGHTNLELRAKIREAEHLATHDALTNLPNRALLEDRLEYAIANVERFGPEIAVFLIDIDSFKTINDTYGHAFGDALLKQVAARLRDCLRSFDTLARLGGDEFAVILQGSHLARHAASVADRMAEYVSGHYYHDGLDVFLTISIGIAVYPNDGRDVAALVKNAETAMYRAKQEGGSQYRFYDTRMSEEVSEQLLRQVELRRALQNREFRLFFQPRVETASGRILGAEALIRWAHPERGLLEPETFIDAAEESGMVTSLDKWLLDAVCREIAAWHKDGLPRLLTTVNVSGRQFTDSGYVDALRTILEVTRIDAQDLGLEITEGVLVEHTEEVDAIFRELKAMGLKLLLDDFGTRYSSLNYLKRFPVDTLKIDRSFIQGVPDDHDDCALVEAMINIAHSLRMDVVAEGVETEAQLQWLRDHRCDSVQGFLISEPVPADEFRRLLAGCDSAGRLSS